MSLIKVLVWLVMFLSIVNSYSERHFHIFRCVMNITERYIPLEHILAISWPIDFRNSSNRNLFKIPSVSIEHYFFNGNSEWSYSVYRPVKQSTTVEETFFYGGYIVFAHFDFHDVSNSIDVFWYQVYRLFSGPSWNPHAPFIVALLNSSDYPPLVAETILKVLKMFRIRKPLVVVTEKLTETLDMYTLFPHKCSSLRVVFLDSWAMEGDGFFVLHTDLFSNKINRNFQKCPLKVFTLTAVPSVGFPIYTFSNKTQELEIQYEDGWEIQLLKIIAQKLNMTEKYILPDWEKIGPEIDFGRPLYDGEADVAFSAIITREHTYYDVTRGYLWDTTRWYVPCGKKYPEWESIYRICDCLSWLSWIVSIILAAGVLSFLSRGTLESTEYKSFAGALHSACSITLGVSVACKPKTLPLRWFFLSWVIYSYALDTVFQAFLTTFLIDPGMVPHITNVKDLVESNMALGVFNNHVFYFNNSEDPYGMMVMNKRIDCTFNSTCFIWAAQYHNLSLLSTEMWFNNITITYESAGIPKGALCSLEDGDVETVYVIMLLQRGSLYLEHFNWVIDGVLESGLFEHWKQMTFHKHKGENYTLVEQSSSEGYCQFTMDVMQSVFIVLLMGYVFSAIALIGECLCFVLTRRSKLRLSRRFVNKRLLLLESRI
ncbi:Ionotropic receptor 580 [Blattella germanica]|nr:Ionotropic receptor 580 [Blattella germanica]